MANIKRHKGIKGATIAICAIGTVALVSVGFAAWVITGGSTASDTGVIKVDVVSDSSYTIKLNDDWEEGKGDIVFGIPEEKDQFDDDGNKLCAEWLTVEGSEYENLSVTRGFKVYNVTETTNLNELLDLQFDLQDFTKDYDGLDSVKYGYISALPNTKEGTLYLTLPETDAEGKLDLQSDTSGNYVECSATATFSWGTAFGGQNPYFYSAEIEAYEKDNEFEISGTIKTQLDFSNALKTINTDLNDVTYRMTILAAGGSDAANSGDGN